jgi:hypothetical protein
VMEPTEPEKEYWIFTFGAGERLDFYVRIEGSYASARAEMLQRHGQKWALQYRDEIEAGVATYNLRDYVKFVIDNL